MNTDELQFSQLVDWLEGRLSDEESRQVEEKLASADETTLADLAWLRSFVEASEAAQSPAPPPEIRSLLRENFRAYARSQAVTTPLKRILATLAFDSRTRFAGAGVRSATAEGSSRQFIYDSDLAEIALNLQADPQNRRLSLVGQVFPRADFPAEGISIQVTDSDGANQRGQAITDELGEFVIESLPEGNYFIYINPGGYEIIIPDVHCSVSA